MCSSSNDHDLYFYYVADKCKRISDDWNTLEYVFFILLISLIVFIWCDTVSENEECCTPCGGNRPSGSSPKVCAPKQHRNSPCSSYSCTKKMCKLARNNNKTPKQSCCPKTDRSRSATPPLRRSLRLRRKALCKSRPEELSNSNINIPLHEVEQGFCMQWCKRRAAERCLEQQRRARSRSRSRNRQRTRSRSKR